MDDSTVVSLSFLIALSCHSLVCCNIAVGDYDPLRSISLFLDDSAGGQRLLDVRAPSAWSAQLWVDGLTAAHYVYKCMLEQCHAALTNKEIASWYTRTLYLPPSKSFTRRPLESLSSCGSQSDSEHEMKSTPPQRIVLESGSRHQRETDSPTTPGLPYVYSTFSTICPCHAYEIVPSRSVDLRSVDLSQYKSHTPGCCSRCRDACKIALDMDNL